MSEEAKTEKYGFTTSMIEHFIGDGEGYEKTDLKPMDLVGDDPEVARLMFELMAASNQKHWYATVTVPENATVNTKLWAECQFSPDFMGLAQKLLEKHNLPRYVNGELISKFGEPDPASGRPQR